MDKQSHGWPTQEYPIVYGPCLPHLNETCSVSLLVKESNFPKRISVEKAGNLERQSPANVVSLILQAVEFDHCKSMFLNQLFPILPTSSIRSFYHHLIDQQQLQFSPQE